MTEKNISIIPTTVEHIRQIAGNLREDDLREIEKWGAPPFKAIWRSYKSSKICRSGFVNGEIVAIWGISGSLLGIVANPWLITSKAADEYPFVFTMIYRREISEMLKSYQLLETFCDTAYTKSLKLMRIIGFKEREFVPAHNGLLVRLEIEAT